jgi:uncharacterized membrane protein
MNYNIPYNRGAIDAPACISEAWDLIKDKYWLFLGIVLVGMLMTGCIPVLKHFLYGPVSVGIYFAISRKMRNEEVSFDNLFKGFQIFVPAMVVGLIESALPLLNDIVSLFSNTTQILLQMLDLEGKFPQFERTSFVASDPNVALAGGAAGFIIVLVIVMAAVFIIVGFAWRITFMFALPLMADHPELSVGEAISLGAKGGWANPGGIIVLMILQTLVALLGLIALCIGIFFVMPVIEASNFVAYRMVFPDVPRQNVYEEPPQPQYYGGTFGNQ